MQILLRTTVLLAALGACAVVAAAQNPRLQIDTLSHLENIADKVVDVSLDEKLMGMAARIIVKANHDHNPDTQKIADVIAGIKGIYVRSYEFENENQYSASDVEMIRAQVKGPGWSRLVGVRSKHEGENAEVYMLMPADKM